MSGRHSVRELSMLSLPELSALVFWTGIWETRLLSVAPGNLPSLLHLSSHASENWSV